MAAINNTTLTLELSFLAVTVKGINDVWTGLPITIMINTLFGKKDVLASNIKNLQTHGFSNFFKQKERCYHQERVKLILK